VSRSRSLLRLDFDWGRSASQLLSKTKREVRPSRSVHPFALTKNGIRIKVNFINVFGVLCACQASKSPRVVFLAYGDGISSSSRMCPGTTRAETHQSGCRLGPN